MPANCTVTIPEQRNCVSKTDLRLPHKNLMKLKNAKKVSKKVAKNSVLEARVKLNFIIMSKTPKTSALVKLAINQWAGLIPVVPMVQLASRVQGFQCSNGSRN